MSATFDFFKADFAGTLFPLKTNLLVAEKQNADTLQFHQPGKFFNDAAGQIDHP